jgi:sugar lactone lactonase YvrE
VVFALIPMAASRRADAGPKATTVAKHLDSPRGLGFAPDGSLYVAEAGRGGRGPCFPGPEGGEVCFGTTGAVTRVRKGAQHRVVSGLPSIAPSDGSSALGPADIAFGPGREMYLSMGLGADPAIREDLPKAAQRASGWLLQQPTGRNWSPIADIAGFEAKDNPDGAQVDSNPNGVLSTSRGRAVVDAGGNSLIWVDPRGARSTVATFPGHPPIGQIPIEEDTPVPIESVPTSVERGPDGAFYVGELTGFPFVPGIARVYRVDPQGELEVFAEGFTNIIDLGFTPDGTLFVLEIAHNGLLSGDPTGALIRVDRNGEREIVMSEGLTYPGGLALRGRAAYVSNCGSCASDGSVLRIPLGE